ncbi:MAG: sugar phosphate isomerase/epimerase [Desulfarculus sp.]|nr:sugar phosphate isomerase/epimerase [Pseudomonadota bacterium]MBV1715189.1 sugar phosphate isomerase/epimerase [Desulfarculus sp.]MBU4574485.1 sugar phosphate isomerase/epimerase [Pseudomonadota bacterium]MBU4598264.1 sugar phosphate isomerase/epimerase [Pseudomonadota bacterium]MBV1736687.1 sugar phosphate isomerase/epimerase [Desulfarculus sp.]
MQTSMDAYIKMGIVHFMAYPQLGGGAGPWAQTAARIGRDPFFTAIEITHIADPAEREKVREVCRLAKLAVGFGAHPPILGNGLNINSLDEDERLAAVARLEELLDEAIYMDAESFVVLSGKDPGEEGREEALEALAASLGRLCAYSAQRGGPPVIAEVFDCAVDKCCLLGPAPLAARVAEMVKAKHGNFGLLVDLSHIPLLGETPQQALEPVAGHLMAAHIGNAVTVKGMPAYGDYHPIFGTPGSVNDVPEVLEFLRVLRDIGFLDGAKRPMVSFEIKPMEGQDPELVIANAQRVMNLAWAQL